MQLYTEQKGGDIGVELTIFLSSFLRRDTSPKALMMGHSTLDQLVSRNTRQLAENFSLEASTVHMHAFQIYPLDKGHAVATYLQRSAAQCIIDLVIRIDDSAYVNSANCAPFLLEAHTGHVTTVWWI